MTGNNITKKVKQKMHTDYPFAEMKVDDFFYVTVNDDADRQTIRSAAYNHSKRKGGKFSVTTYSDVKTKVVRVE